MRKLTIRDLVASLIVAAVMVPFIGYSVRGSMPFVHDPRGMAAVGVAGGLLAFAVLGRKAFGTGTFQRIMGHLAVITLGCGIAALFGEISWGLLVLMTAGIVIMWALALAHDAGYLASSHVFGPIGGGHARSPLVRVTSEPPSSGEMRLMSRFLQSVRGTRRGQGLLACPR